MRIRQLSDRDLEAILKIQNSSGQAAAWNKADYQQLIDNPLGLVLVAELESATPPEITGFAAFHRVGEEAELWNLAVAPERRRQGIGNALFEAAIQQLHKAGAQKIFLEVRASNTPALQFYRAKGFQTLQRRKLYYQNPSEDALILSLDLPPGSRS